MIDRSEYSKKLDGLKPEDLGKATRGAFTVIKVEEVELQDSRTQEKRKALAITFDEFPKKPYWPNGTSINILCDVLGENENKWIDKKIPLEKVKANNPQTNRVQDSLWVAKAEDWDSFPGIGSNGYGGTTKRANRSTTKKKVAKKR